MAPSPNFALSLAYLKKGEENRQNMNPGPPNVHRNAWPLEPPSQLSVLKVMSQRYEGRGFWFFFVSVGQKVFDRFDAKMQRPTMTWIKIAADKKFLKSFFFSFLFLV